MRTKQTLGAEIEFTGLTRKAAVDVIAKYFGTTASTVNDLHSEIRDTHGRIWDLVSDSSIATPNERGRSTAGYDSDYSNELVTPILDWADIETVAAVATALKQAGAIVNATCGLHVHIGAQGMTATAITNLVNSFASHEALLFKALGVHGKRKRYCQTLDKKFLRTLNERRPQTLDELGAIWYQRETGNFPLIHYHESRYHALNLHAVFTHGTIEFRIFNGTLEAGEIIAAMQFSSALVAAAKKAKWTIYRPIETADEKTQLRQLKTA